MAGRHPQSIHHHQQTGNYRPSRHGRDGLPVERPEGYGLPGDLSPHGRAFWTVVTAQLEFAGYLSRIDGPALRLAAEAWADYVAACDEIAANGMFVSKPTKYGVVRVRSPAWDVKRDAAGIIGRVLDRFGMSPRMRTGLVTDMPDADDEEALARAVFGDN